MTRTRFNPLYLCRIRIEGIKSSSLIDQAMLARRLPTTTASRIARASRPMWRGRSVYARFLSGSSLTASWIPKWWSGFLDAQSRNSIDFDIWLPLANEFGVRGAMQHNVPPLMIHASTTANWGVNHGRHIPGCGDCLLDRFDAPSVTTALTCAAGKVSASTAGTPVDAALPFA